MSGGFRRIFRVFPRFLICLSGWPGIQLVYALGFLIIFGMLYMLGFCWRFCSYFLQVAFWLVPWIWHFPGFFQDGACMVWAVPVFILRCLLGGSLFWICFPCSCCFLLLLWRWPQPSYWCFSGCVFTLSQVFLSDVISLRSWFSFFFNRSPIIILFLSVVVSISSSPDSIYSTSLGVDSGTISVLF